MPGASSTAADQTALQNQARRSSMIEAERRYSIHALPHSDSESSIDPSHLPPRTSQSHQSSQGKLPTHSEEGHNDTLWEQASNKANDAATKMQNLVSGGVHAAGDKARQAERRTTSGPQNVMERSRSHDAALAQKDQQASQQSQHEASSVQPSIDRPYSVSASDIRSTTDASNNGQVGTTTQSHHDNLWVQASNAANDAATHIQNLINQGVHGASDAGRKAEEAAMAYVHKTHSKGPNKQPQDVAATGAAPSLGTSASSNVGPNSSTPTQDQDPPEQIQHS